MTVKLLTAKARLSLYLSKWRIVGNHMSQLIFLCVCPVNHHPKMYSAIPHLWFLERIWVFNWSIYADKILFHIKQNTWGREANISQNISHSYKSFASWSLKLRKPVIIFVTPASPASSTVWQRNKISAHQSVRSFVRSSVRSTVNNLH